MMAGGIFTPLRSTESIRSTLAVPGRSTFVLADLPAERFIRWVELIVSKLRGGCK
jgi:hypothetical protein